MNDFLWRVSGSSAQGLRHIENNIPCQDKIFSMRKNGITAIALADGAGSLRFSHYGAEEVVKSICEKLCSEFESMINNPDALSVKNSIMKSLSAGLENVAEKIGCDIKELGSTLLAAASDNENILLVHLGDGIIACIREGKIIPASYPDNGEAKNETYFVTSPDAVSRMRILKGNAEKISGVILMSDGTEESFFNRREKKFAPLLDEIKQHCIIYPEEDNNKALNELFNNVVINKTRDDCSLIIMCRPDEYFRGYRDLEEYDKYNFLNVKTLTGRIDREKIFSIIADNEGTSRAQIVREGLSMGLKRKRILGLIRDLNKNGFISKVSFFNRKYRLTFNY